MPGILVFLALMSGDPANVQLAQAPGHNPLDCYCRAEGRFYAEGETICLKTADGPRLAQCDMAINVMSWIISPKPCPVT
ncbi:hypothetical protein MHY87_03025 [Microvirga sp. ACRRW]|uniref:hypothetical protein n=1 Tax=Microvirga sp. ACRRW TaxID=2918205 RepID=UPI001EF66580|nr:hypothetical protein [Microvirga sp. ACRRW]MCG7391878.1 hypothetical protein [Microvirga sp. ACRRW]